MKSLVVAITLVLSTQFVTAAMKAGSAVNVTDQTRVKCSFVIGSNRTIAAPPRRLLDDNSLLPTLRAKEKSTTLRADEMMQQTGIRFQENRGQIVDTRGELRPEIAFVANAPGARLYFRNDGISYVFTKTMHTQTIDLPLEGIGSENVSPCGEKIMIDPKNVSSWGEIKMGSENVSPWGEIKRGDNQREEIQTYRLDMKLVGCNPFARIRAEGELPGYVNYYLAHCPDGITGIKEYSRIVYESVYDNIDLELFSSNGRMKYNFVVRPGGDVSDINMKYDGATETALTQDGALAVATPLGRIEEATPYTYSGDESNEVFSRFLRKGNTVSFAVDEYDQSQTLVIDPWATYYGGSGFDKSTSVTTDAIGNVIVSGITASTNFPVSIGAFQMTYAGGTGDAFVVKFDANGNRLWATFYGGSGNEVVWTKVATDASSNVIISGRTNSTNFPVTSGAFQTSYGGGDEDAYIVKFNGSGTRLWATYCGGKFGDGSFGVTTDASGNVIIAGLTLSTNFPVTSGAFQTSKAKGRDAFIMKFNPSGGRLWGTYYGGKGDEYLTGSVVADESNIYVTSSTRSSNFPITTGSFQTAYSGGVISGDAFILKFSNSGNRIWATYYGGSYDDDATGVAIDGSSNVVITGHTQSLNFPTTNGAFQTSLSGYSDAYLVKLNTNGTRLWATYVGGGSSDFGEGVSTDGNANIFASGYTSSTNFPITFGALQTTHGGNNDAFLIKFNGSGSLLWSTFYGGSGEEKYGSVATYTNGNVAFTCLSTSTNLALHNPYQPTNAGGSDAVVVFLNSNGFFLKRSVAQRIARASITLNHNFPNPFHSMTMISFSLNESRHVRISIYDLLGKEVAVLEDKIFESGVHTSTWKVDSSIPTGNYMLRLTSSNSDGKGEVSQRVLSLLR